MTASALPGAWRARSLPDGGFGLSPVTPLDADAAMIGTCAARAVALTAALHGLCPHAHAIAAQRALENAVGFVATPELDAQRGDVLELEAAGAAAFRIGCIWPQAYGARADRRAGVAFTAAARAIAARKAGANPQPDCAILADALTALATQTDAPSRAESILGQAPDPAAQDRPLAARFAAIRADAIARARDLTAIRQAPPTTEPPVAEDGSGIGAARALRGAVTIQLTRRAGMITAWRSSAPTDRILAPHSPLHLALRGATAAQAPWVVLAFDPCAPVLFAPTAAHAHA